VATDHIIESFRNDLWDGYKDGSGIDPALYAQFPVLEDALAALGVAVWAMVEHEADDALASAAAVAAADDRVERVIVCTPDKDLGQTVGGRWPLDRRKDTYLDAEGVRQFGVAESPTGRPGRRQRRRSRPPGFGEDCRCARAPATWRRSRGPAADAEYAAPIVQGEHRPARRRTSKTSHAALTPTSGPSTTGSGRSGPSSAIGEPDARESSRAPAKLAPSRG
jgi:hypothetical protein